MNRCKAKAPRFLSEWMGFDWLKSIIQRDRKRDEMGCILTFAYFAMTNWFGWITVIAFFAIVAMTSSCCMSTIQTNTTRYTARQFVQFHVEAASSRVSITVAGCEQENEMKNKRKPFRMIYLSRGKHQRFPMIYSPWWECVCFFVCGGDSSELRTHPVAVNWMRHKANVNHSKASEINPPFFVAVTVRLFCSHRKLFRNCSSAFL